MFVECVCLALAFGAWIFIWGLLGYCFVKAILNIIDKY